MRLLSWNVQSCRGMDGTVDAARIAAEARRLADPDVLCLQELETEELARQFPGYAAFYAWGVDVPAGASGRSRFGNLLLSCLPVGRVRRHSLPWPDSPGAPSMPRVAVESVIEAPFGPLRVVTTHLEYYSAEHRAAQVGRLRAIQAEATGARQPVPAAGPFTMPGPLPRSAILCGDFNFPPQDPLHGRIREAGFADAWQSLHPGKLHPPTFRLHEKEREQAPYCCDFIFVTQDLVPRLRSIRIDADTQASDHQPVMLELS
ncbi:MAG TPA: endonuclease/exonuclease/phosphatase family protein [Burkholderiales bacterium]